MNDINVRLEAQVSFFREEAQVSACDAARACGLKLAEYEQCEAGKLRLSFEQLYILSKLFGVQLRELIGLRKA